MHEVFPKKREGKSEIGINVEYINFSSWHSQAVSPVGKSSVKNIQNKTHVGLHTESDKKKKNKNYEKKKNKTWKMQKLKEN